MPVISTKREFAKRILRRSFVMITPSFRTSSTASIWVSHSGLSTSSSNGCPVMRAQLLRTRCPEVSWQEPENHPCRTKKKPKAPSFEGEPEGDTAHDLRGTAWRERA